MSDSSNPQIAHRDMKRAEPRPTQLGVDTAEIQERVRASQIDDTRDTFKLYAQEWLHKYTGSEDDCREFFVANFDGRVKDEDWRIAAPFDGSKNVWLECRLWSVLAECKTMTIAETWRQHFIDGGRSTLENTRIVGRNSRDEVVLRDYGVKKLVGVREKLEKDRAASE